MAFRQGMVLAVELAVSTRKQVSGAERQLQ